MDTKNYEQMVLTANQVGDGLHYLKEGMNLEILTCKDVTISMELPAMVELQVVATEPGFKGDTATGGSKPAKLETGINVQVPLFINVDDIIKVDTRSGEYLEKAS
jgi:elongation factor P